MRYLFEVSVCLIAFYSVYHFLLHQEKSFQFNRFYLLSSLILSFVIPGFELELASTTPNFTNSYNAQMDTFLESSIWIAPGTTAISPLQVLIGIYWIVVGIGFIRLIFSLLKLWNLKRKGTTTQKQGYTLVYTSNELPVFSFFKLIFWSENTEHNHTQQELILAHELAHVQQLHSIDVLFLEIARIFLWFNPILFFYQQKMKEVHEFIADAAVISTQCTTLIYADLMMQEAKRHQKSVGIAHSFHHPIKNRLIMLSKTKKPLNILKALFSLPVLVLLFFTFSTTGNLMGQANKSAQPTEPKTAIAAAKPENKQLKAATPYPPNAQPGKCYAICKVSADSDDVRGEWKEIPCPKDMTENLVRKIQEKLTENGYPVTIDATLGQETKSALTQYQKANNLPIGQFDMATLKKLGVK